MAAIFKDKNFFLIQSEDFLFCEWKFEQCDMRRGKVLRSQDFKVGEGKTSFLKMEVIDCDVFLKIINPKFSRDGYYMVVIRDKNGSDIFKQFQTTEKYLNKYSVDLLSISITELLSPKNFPITVSSSVKFSSMNVLNKEAKHYSSKHLDKLSSDFKRLLGDSINYDIVLDVNGEEIKAHRAILQARSPVFNKMFQHDSAERTVAITDIEGITMKRLLSYLYTGTLEKSDLSSTIELYYAADKYEVLSLRDACRVELLNNINAYNACLLFTVANQHSDEAFLDEVAQFVQINFKSVVHSDAFDELSKDEMKLMVRTCATANVKSECVLS